MNPNEPNFPSPRRSLLPRVFSFARTEPRWYVHAERTIPCACRLCNCPSAGGRRYSFVYVREDPRLIYFNVPKSASTMIRHAVFENRNELSMRDPEHDESEYLRFAFVRNPWSRMVSAWTMFSTRDRRIRQIESMTDDPPTDFAGFVDFALRVPNHHWQPQSLYVPEDIEFVGRLETFDADFARLCELSGLEPYPVRRTNRTRYKHYTEHYTPELVERVGAFFADDVRRFGYEFDPR